MDETDTQEIVVDFGKICRLCLTGDGVLINLFPSDHHQEIGTKTIPEKVMDLMSIAVIKNDGFPSWICHNCLSLVDKCYEFFDQCRTNQAALNESYIAALSEAGVSVVPLKVSYIDNEDDEAKTCEQVIEVPSSAEVKVPKKDVSQSTVDKEFPLSECTKELKTSNESHVQQFKACYDDLVYKPEEVEHKPDSRGFYNCIFCNAKFHNKNAISTHVNFKHTKTENDHGVDLEKLMFCKYCGLSFSRKNISRHMEVVHRMTKNTEPDQKDISFDCRICYRPFLRESSLRTHIEKVHGDNLEMMAEVENCEIVWNCSECDSVFLNVTSLMQHFGNKHSKYPLEVDTLRGLKSRNLICNCGVISSNSFDATLHGIFFHSDVKQFEWECPGCEKKFRSSNELQIHLISFHWFSSMSYENNCVFCGQSFKSNDLLRCHLNETHLISFEKNTLEDNKTSKRRKEDENEVKSEAKSEVETFDETERGTEDSSCLFVCESCGEFCKTEKNLEVHYRNCNFSHKCKLCGKGYKTNNHLKRHVAEFHNTLAPIKCPLCPKIFPRKMNLHHHYKRRHLKQTKKFVCSYCGQSLKGIVALRSHEDRLHRNVRQYKCSDCPEAFTTRGILRKHAQRHLTERPMLQCQFCEKKFSTISGIERHIKTHEGVKEFQCDMPHCGKSFYTKSELKRHIKFHTRDFKHICPVCNHKFMSPGELKKHSTKHTGERPFKCHLCSCAYARRDDKVKHLKRVHNLKVKRVYGKSLLRTGEDDYLVDTIVIDEGSTENTNADGAKQ
ncbi:hypothetical protein RUM43_010519 [Polyplax serrata]|uniref:Uncharacterized protein n=1 Tax=Polyplax serrata TaxID=468196 RepID=A0AAN8PLI3_POLSC